MADLTTLANVKQYLNLGTNTSADALLGRLISAASSWVRSYLNRDITQQAYTDTLDGTGTQRMIVAQYPVTALTSVTVDGQDVTANVISDGRRLLKLKDGYGVFTEGTGNVVVNYTAGYATTPYDIEQAVIEIVALRFREKDRVGTSTVNTRGESVTFNVTDVPASVRTLLNNYRKVVA